MEIPLVKGCTLRPSNLDTGDRDQDGKGADVLKWSTCHSHSGDVDAPDALGIDPKQGLPYAKKL